jgi:hypothetical protein
MSNKLKPRKYTGQVNIRRRDTLLAYGRRQVQEPAMYTVHYEDGDYFNIDMSLLIQANNDAEAVVVWLDYLNNNLKVLYPSDAYESDMWNIDGVEGDVDTDLSLAGAFVDFMFENDTLYLKKHTTIISLRE